MCVCVCVCKGTPLTGHEGPRGFWMYGVLIYTAMALRRGGWLVLRSATFTPRENPGTHFCRRLSRPQDQPGHEGAKKNLHPSPPPTPWIDPGCQRVCRVFLHSCRSRLALDLFGIVISTSDCHPKGPGFDSRLYPRNVSGSIGSGTGSTQPREDNWVAT